MTSTTTTTVKTCARQCITALPSAEEFQDALSTLSGNAQAMELNIQVALAYALHTYHATEGPERFAGLDSVRAVAIPSGYAKSLESALQRVTRATGDDVHKAKAAITFATDTTADMFAHETRKRRDKAKKAADKREKDKADREALKAENETLKSGEVVVPEFIITDGNGEVSATLSETEYNDVLAFLAQLRSSKQIAIAS